MLASGVGNRIKNIDITHYSGKQNFNAGCFSRQPVMPALPTDGLEDEVQIVMISRQPGTIDSLLQLSSTR